ncbi:hypothetical protein RIF29_21576 [Crotalaria pallida]|uniref:Uncharacterized protein n=1 Tax=Crotalaria pallida TaxID=3830 RepID=A0AAN9I7B4_CROPI
MLLGCYEQIAEQVFNERIPGIDIDLNDGDKWMFAGHACNAGQVRKSLSIKPHTNNNGYFISLNVVNNLSNSKEFFSVTVTAAEFAVMKTACSVIKKMITLSFGILTIPSRNTVLALKARLTHY